MIKNPFAIYDPNVKALVMCLTENNTIFYTHDPFEAARFKTYANASDVRDSILKNGTRFLLDGTDEEIPNSHPKFYIVRLYVDFFAV